MRSKHSVTFRLFQPTRRKAAATGPQSTAMEAGRRGFRRPDGVRAVLAVAALLCAGTGFAFDGSAPSSHGADPFGGGPATPLRHVVRITTGTFHSCASLTGGAMRCWGDNIYSQLGNGDSYEQPVAVPVIGLASGVQSISGGGSHTCAVANGAARCWAYNYFGQVGDGTDTDRDIPTPVIGLASGTSAISAGMNHSCALTSTGGVKCWGANGFGQLGDGTDTNRLSPVNVSGLSSGVQAISAGGEHTCALTTAGGVRCWGNNDYGQIGDGSTTQRSTPVNVSGLTSGVQAISAGRFHTCAVLTTGAVRCWGINEDGQLGDGSTIDRSTPVNVSGFSTGGHAVAAGALHTCAVTTGGAARCWGYNGWGQLGNGTTTSSLVPVNVTGLSSGVLAIAAGGSHSCAAGTDGRARCWGGNEYGQLGDDTWNDSTTPVFVLQADGIFAHPFE
ncbi:RCC1 domain-containing protein [Pseudofulvimonas gallinarii]|jgi:alpha-tubulin suppressor-like RCC1 family protein|uniref:Alpha-tubulin suppressor-like RCC1 family protein n=1 Tax=Pseudofulvimonas gallinarii TaxID=634155 RepID=A0A4R3LIT5_9GAMM|nr:alpha-tubulin suppressor-like RCC1 family protein [Pseudofulvimonas gallinarii]